MISINSGLKNLFKNSTNNKKKLLTRQIKFWANVGLSHFNKFYNKGINCEVIDWKIIEDIIDWMYKKCNNIQKKLIKDYGKNFIAKDKFMDEFDVIYMRELFEAIKENKIKLDPIIVDTFI